MPEKPKRKTKTSFKEKLSEAFDIPKELVLDIGKVTLIGRKQVIIENYKGIVEYEENRIRLFTQEGIINIEGKAMDIKEITSEDIMILGEIYSLQFLQN